ncbi:MAG: NUDIX hydrolase [Archangiaceae bacterium]|nr:NUDIX hydrolase [Archangiaceae bacterium]
MRTLTTVSQAGLTYSKDPFDRERYEQLSALCIDIAAAHAGLPREQVEGTLELGTGYPTPKVDVRAAVFDGQGRILMVRESQDGRWSLSGGWADLGLSPSEVAVKEVREETGYAVRTVKLLEVAGAHPLPTVFSVYKLFLRCELEGGAAATSHETTEVGWFARDAIPPLSERRTRPELLQRMFVHYDEPQRPTGFD